MLNPRLPVDVLHVAALFAASNLVASDLELAQRIITTLRGKRYGEAKALCDELARPEFGTVMTYYARKQFTALVSKVPFTGDQKSRKRRAQASFFEAEARCRRTNRKLAFYNQHWDRIPEMIRVVLIRARQELRGLMGPLNEKVEDHLIALSRPGSGVAIGTWNRFRVSAPFKYGATDLACTASALPYACKMVEGSFAWLRLHLEVDWEKNEYHVPYVVAHGNRTTYVPKDARTMRTIAIEPHLNVMLQLGVHEYLAHRLEAVGNSIADQTRNQDLARRASVEDLGPNGLVTLDLSQASDSVSKGLVKMLVPSYWYAYLDDIRCEAGEVEGEHLSYEKFSSMGNGTTFVLETLLFLALSRACNSLTGGEVASVYGDDIILSSCSALLLTEVLNWCGFRLNGEKSFYHGPFRESCGADWYRGVRVTPQYVRKAIFRQTDVYRLLNCADPVLNWHEVRQYLLEVHRQKVPILYGVEYEDTSGCLFAPFDYVKGGGWLRWNAEFQNWTFRVITLTGEDAKCSQDWAYVAALRGSDRSKYSLRGRGVYRLHSVTPGVTRGVPRFLA